MSVKCGGQGFGHRMQFEKNFMLLPRSANSPLFRLVKTLLLLILLGTISDAQTSQQANGQRPSSNPQDNVLRIETELVQIDVVVADKQGNLVRNLKREDFELYEDGKKQQLTHFAAGTAAQPAKWLTRERKPAGGGVDKTVATETRAGRYIVLAVDDYHISPANLVYVKRALVKFISQQMVGGDQIAIVTTSGNVGLFQQFTREREVLERAVNRLTAQERNVVDSSSIPHITEHQAELIEFGDRDAVELAVNDIVRNEGLPPSQPGQTGQGRAGGARGGQSGQTGQSGQSINPQREMLENRVRSQARLVLALSANYTRATLDTLEAVIRSLQPLPGRKMLVLLSDGFFLGGNSIHSQVYDVRRIADAATRAGVVIYSIDARGLVAVTPGGDASEATTIDPALAGAQARIELSAVNAKRDGLNALAVDTGGTLFFDSNDLNLGLQRVLDANETYYVLAYEPAESRRDGKFHRIEVRLAGRPELKVRTRKGYFAPTAREDGAAVAKETPKEKKDKDASPEKVAQLLKVEKEKQLLKGIGSLFPLRQIPIEMAVDFLNPREGSVALLNTHIETANLTFEQVGDRQQTVIDLSAVIFDEKGKVASSFTDRLGVSLKPEDLGRMAEYGFNYRKVVPLQPGFYQARIAIREDKTGNLGSAAGWVEIPDLNNKQLTLSGVLLSVGDDGVKEAQRAASSTAVANANSGGYQPRPSSATRRFKNGGSVDFLVFAYNAKVEKNIADLVIQSQVFAGSKLVYASPPSKMTVAPGADWQHIPYAARVSLKDYDPGEYELRLMVIDRLTKATAYRRVNFTVE